MRSPVVDEVCGQNAAVAHVLPVSKLLLVDQAEAIARLDVEREVDVPAEDVIRKAQDDFRADAGGASRYEQGRFDRAVRTRFTNLDGSR